MALIEHLSSPIAQTRLGSLLPPEPRSLRWEAPRPFHHHVRGGDRSRSKGPTPRRGWGIRDGWPSDSWGDGEGCLQEGIWVGRPHPLPAVPLTPGAFRDTQRWTLCFLSPTLGFSTLPRLPPLPQPHQHPIPLSIQLPRIRERGRNLHCLPPSSSASSPSCFQPLSPKHPPPRLLLEDRTLMAVKVPQLQPTL